MSLPALGSDQPWAQTSSEDAIFGRKRAFCSGVPTSMMRRAEQEDAVLVDAARRAGAVVLLFEDQPLEQIGAAAAVLDGPGDHREAAGVELLLPGAVGLEAFFRVEGRELLLRRVRGEPAAGFLAEGCPARRCRPGPSRVLFVFRSGLTVEAGVALLGEGVAGFLRVLARVELEREALLEAVALLDVDDLDAVQRLLCRGAAPSGSCRRSRGRPS